MTENLLLGFASIIVFGITAQWLAWRLGLPSILLLLLFGFVAGPITGFLNPDAVFGDLLFPVVSLAVGLILFEGGLSLKLEELRSTGRVVRNLITVGAFVTWVLSAAAAHLIFGYKIPIALLFGAILVVTGPTVIMPLLRDIRAVGRINSIAKWEGIVNDPIGAVLAVLVFEAIALSGTENTLVAVGTSLLTTILLGLVLGIAGAAAIIFLLRSYAIPDHLQNGFTLMVVLAAFVASNLVQEESGLFTVTLMGVLLANQKSVSIKHIVEFKENLGVLLLSSLFIVLAARLQMDQISQLGWSSGLFLLTLIFVVRPICILLSTIRSRLSWKEKLFLSWMAPRGIVAAAVTAVFALELSHIAGYEDAEKLVPEMFLIIFGTVTVYGLSAAPLGRWLGVAQPNPQGVMIAGAHPWARTIAAVLKDEGFQVLLVDTNRENITAARLAGCQAIYANVLSDYIVDDIEMGSIGRLLALTPNNEVNSLAVLHFIDVFGRAGVYQLPPQTVPQKRKKEVAQPLRGRYLFDTAANYAYLNEMFEHGAVVKATPLTKEFKFGDFQKTYGDDALPLFLKDQLGNLNIYTTDNQPLPQPGQTVISVVYPNGEKPVLDASQALPDLSETPQLG